MLAGAFAYRVAHPNTIPARMWSRYSWDHLRCSVLMPAYPYDSRAGPEFTGITPALGMLARYAPLDKSFELYVGTLDRIDGVPGRPPSEILQDCKRDLERELLSWNEYSKWERINSPNGGEGLQIVLTVSRYNAHKGQVQITRMFVVDDRLYVLSVTGEDIEPSDDDVKKFFESFRVDSAFPKAGSAPAD